MSQQVLHSRRTASRHADESNGAGEVGTATVAWLAWSKRRDLRMIDSFRSCSEKQAKLEADKVLPPKETPPRRGPSPARITAQERLMQGRTGVAAREV